MFWGLVMNPNQWYTQTVKIPFHVSMATLDIATANHEIVQVILYYNNKNYQLCSLNKDSIWQVPLDLNFEKGTKVAFTCSGQSHVYLTGYLKPDKDSDLDEQEEEDDDNNKENEEDYDNKDNEEEDDDSDDTDEERERKEIQKRSSKKNKKYKLNQQHKLKKNQNK